MGTQSRLQKEVRANTVQFYPCVCSSSVSRRGFGLLGSLASVLEINARSMISLAWEGPFALLSLPASALNSWEFQESRWRHPERWDTYLLPVPLLLSLHTEGVLWLWGVGRPPSLVL